MLNFAATSSPVPKESMAPELSGQEETESREDSVPIPPATPPRSPAQHGHYRGPSTGKEEGAGA